MKITVDTNNRIIKRVEDGELELVLSAEILEEFEGIMGQGKGS